MQAPTPLPKGYRDEGKDKKRSREKKDDVTKIKEEPHSDTDRDERCDKEETLERGCEEPAAKKVKKNRPNKRRRAELAAASAEKEMQLNDD